MRRHVLLACLTVALAIPAFPAVAHADDAAVVEAKQRFEEGLELADAGKHEPARLKFQQAWSVFKAPAVLYNLARSEQLTGHDLEALEHFRLFAKVSATDAKITDAMREKAKQNAVELAAKVAQVDIDAPPTARVSVDGKPLEDSPKDPVAVAPGRHRIEATFDGKLRAVTVECTAGHIVKARVDFDSTTEPPGEQQHESSARWVVPVALGVAGLAGIGLGVGFGASSQSAKTDSEGLRRTNPGLCAQPSALCESYDGRRSDAESASTISKIGYVGGGVLVAGAVVAFVLWPKTKERAASTRRGMTAEGIRPLIGAGTLGGGLEGHF